MRIARCLLIILLMVTAPSLQGRAGGESIPSLPLSAADSLATRQVIWNGRVCPFNTLATEFVTKLYGRRRCHGYTPEQVVASWALYPETWNRAPILRIKSGELRRRLGLTDGYAAITDLFDERGAYRLQPIYAAEANKNSRLAKAVSEVDEKVALVMMLLDGTLIQPVPDDAPRLSPTRIRAELLYNRVPFVDILFMANLALGILGFLVLLFRRTRHDNTLTRRWLGARWYPGEGRLVLWLSTLALAFTYALRWYIGGRIPLSNGFETMLFMALAVQVVALVLSHRAASSPSRRTSDSLSSLSRRVVAVYAGFLLSGFALLVAHLAQMDPQITALSPALDSPWLATHVSTIMVSYALFAFTFVVALPGLFGGPQTRERCRRLSHRLLVPAVFLLTIGIILGSIWAKSAWGSYWSWDPKETWALITLIVYLVPLLAPLLPVLSVATLSPLSSPRLYHAYMLFAFLTVLMTYFGVNYVLGGLHSYAN